MAEGARVVTMQEVANRANVSISTVSFVLNNTKPVTPATRQRVLAAISELGYRRNTMARALASRKSHILALIYPMADHRNHHSFIEAAATAAAEHGYNLVLWPLHSDHVTAEISSLIEAGFADGVLLMEVQLEDERVGRLQQANAPFVLIGRTRELDGIDYVDIDFERTTELAVNDLVRLGHRDITLLLEDLSATPLAGYAPPFRAEAAFRAIAEEQGVAGTVLHIPHQARAISAAPELILAEAPRTTAVIAMHDEAALSLVNSLPHRGIEVPRDMSVVALATATTMSDLTDPALSTYVAPGHVLGRNAAELLIARLEGRGSPAAQVLVTCVPHEGGTVAEAAARPEAVSVSDTPLSLS